MTSTPDEESSPAEPNFSIEVLKSGAGGNHGLLTSVAAGSSVLAAGTTKGYVVRNDFVNDEISGNAEPRQACFY